MQIKIVIPFERDRLIILQVAATQAEDRDVAIVRVFRQSPHRIHGTGQASRAADAFHNIAADILGFVEMMDEVNGGVVALGQLVQWDHRIAIVLITHLVFVDWPTKVTEHVNTHIASVRI